MNGRIVIGDCRESLEGIPEKSAHVAVTSPPYWGLRSYIADESDAKGNEIGLERTPEAYIANMVDVFRAVRRVLRDDGVCWLNLGDSYAREGGDGAPGKSARVGTTRSAEQRRNLAPPPGLKPGDLVGIPWAVALALRADGWYLRSDVIWAKRNTMPESVAGWRWERCRVKVRSLRRGNNRGVGEDLSMAGADQAGGSPGETPAAEWRPCPGCPKCSAADGYVLRRGAWRPTKAHEMVFMLAKSERYFADGEAVREAITSEASIARNRSTPRSFGSSGAHNFDRTDRGRFADHSEGAGRNLRDVWHLASIPSRLRHFAMMPPALVEKCILAGPEKVCEACGAPWARVVERSGGDQEARERPKHLQSSRSTLSLSGNGSAEWAERGARSTTLGFRRTCTCSAPAIAPLILDPFLGAGTVAGVAEVLGRRWAGCELSADYAALVPQRIEEVRAYFARRAGRRTERARPSGPGQTSLFSLFGDQP